MKGRLLRKFTKGLAMRSDAANLLSRLGQSKFRYQEFGDSFADMELWPLFEALIRDPRISGAAGFAERAASGDEVDTTKFGARPPAPVPSAALPSAALPSAALPAAPEPRPAGLFGRYQPAAATEADGHQDVRSLLSHLGNRVAAGEL
jgi:hypothetical protein